ncbi:MAG: cytidylate kinase family protein [Spirochaetales bacterium]|nr:cytidylate kinase family protein [Spirochaetales bacterium]
MSIITISRIPGSGGNEVARQLADRKNLNLLDRIAIDKYIQEHPEYPGWVKRLDEHTPGLLDRGSDRRSAYLDILKLTVYETALKGNSLILGRGGQFLLRDIPGVFHVRLICSEERGRERISLLLEDKDAPVDKIYHRMVHDREGFHKYFFHADGHDPTYYDLVVNTDHISQERVLELIDHASEHIFATETAETARKMIMDRYLAQKIHNRIIYERQMAVNMLEVTVNKGKVILSGSVVSDKISEACIELAREEEGVNQVESLLYLYIPGRYGLY